MRKKVLLFIVAVLVLGTITPVASAAVKPGTKCSKQGKTSTSGGIKYTCIKSGKKLIWNKGVSVKKPTPTATPSALPTPTDFEPWSTDIDSKMLSDQAQRNFLNWVQSRAGVTANHTQVIQENFNSDRISILKKSDDLGAQLFSSYFAQGSATVIGANEKWTIEELVKSGWNASTCNERYMPGVALCLDKNSRQGYVITGETTYNPMNPGGDGAALLAHEYFHLVQFNLINSTIGIQFKSGDANTVNGFPAWFVEGTAEFVGYSVGALSQNASYWDGRSAMLSYSPRDPFVNRNAIADYEIRVCCGNDTPTYPYNIGQVASEYIIASIGFQKMLDIMISYASTENFEKSFETVTGISKATFYEKFDQIRTKVGMPSISWKLDGLINEKISG